MLTLKVLIFLKFTYKWSGWISDNYCSLKPLCLAMREVEPAPYLTDPTSPIPFHCAVIILFESVPVH